MPRTREDDDDMSEFEDFESEELLDEDGDLDDLDDDLDEVLEKDLLDEETDDDDDDDDEDEDGLEIDRDREDWSESLDDMESDYWEDYTRNGPV